MNRECRLHKHTWFCGGDKQTLQQTYFRGSASCVQSFDDSLDIAIRITYRISLRSSSLWEPRHPLLKVLIRYFVLRKFRITWFLLWFVCIPKECLKGILSFVLKKRVIWYCVLCPRDVFTHAFTWETVFYDLAIKKDVVMILPQVHLRKPCYDFTFL